jgi:hypothetical protein
MPRHRPKPEDLESVPRFKEKKRRSPKGPTVITRRMTPDSTLSREIPDSIKIAIADVIMRFSEMENAAETVIWDLVGVSDDDGKLLTQLDSKDKLELCKKFTERYGMPIHSDIDIASHAWMTIRQSIEARNKIAHGLWYMLHEGSESVPVAVSYRIPAELGRVTGEQFPIDRLVLIGENCEKNRDLLNALLRRIAERPSKPTPQPLTQTPSLGEHPSTTDK